MQHEKIETNREPPKNTIENARHPMQIEERRLFSYEERSAILKSTKGVCAHCGKPLKTSNMTIEHIIPIMRGGTNDIRNLTALCKECNTQKDNLVYLPKSFYLAIIGTPQYNQMEKMVKEWYQEKMKDELDIEMFPLISPIHHMMIAMSPNTRKLKYNRQFVLKWNIVGKDYIEETEAITEKKIRDIRQFLFRAAPDIEEPDIDMNEFFSGCDTDEEFEQKGKELDQLTKEFRIERNKNRHTPVTCYTLRKLTTDKLFALIAVRYDKTRNDAVIYLAWADMTKKAIPKAIQSFLNTLFYAVIGIANCNITNYMILSHYPSAFDYIRNGYINRNATFAHSYTDFKLQDKDEPNDTIHGMIVNVYPTSTKRNVSDYIQIPRYMNLIEN